MNEKKIPRYLRCNEKNSSYIKLQRLYDLMEELGISIQVGRCRTIVRDRDRDEKLPPLEMVDLDDPEQNVCEFPPALECNLIYDNPAYLEAERQANLAARLEREQQEAERKAKEAAEKAERERRIKEEKEQKERKLLAELKAKYES